LNPLIHPYNNQFSLFINIGSFQMVSKPFSPAGLTLLGHLMGVSSNYFVSIGGGAFANAAPLLSTRLLRAVFLRLNFPPFSF